MILSKMNFADIFEQEQKEEITDELLLAFIQKNNIDIEAIARSPMSKNEHESKINYILKTCGIVESDEEIQMVSVKDIVGMNPCSDCSTLFEMLEELYDSSSRETYKTRNLSQIKKSKEDMIEDIKSSLYKEQIHLHHVEDGKYVVSLNGCHRTSMLRLLYIDEALKNPSDIDSIDKKYTIPCMVDTYDLTLSYINYIIQGINVSSWLSVKYDDNYKYTGYFKLTIADLGTFVLTKDEVISRFTSYISSLTPEASNRVETLISTGKNISPSFREFVTTYMSGYEYMLREDLSRESN